MSINGVHKMFALEIEHELIAAITLVGDKGDFPGISIREGADIVGMPYNDFYGAVIALEEMKKIGISQNTGRGRRLMLPSWTVPEYAPLTPKQKTVLNYLASKMNRWGYVRASSVQICKDTSLGCPWAQIDALDYKGFLQIVDFGSPKSARIYQIFPNADGPKGYTWRPYYSLGAKEWSEVQSSRMKEKQNADAM